MARGQPLRAIARQFQVSKDAVSRHKQHVRAALAKATEAAETASATNLIAIVRHNLGELEEMAQKARRERDGGPEARKNIEAIFKGVDLLSDLLGVRAPRVNLHIDLQVPTLTEGLEIAQELLLDGMTAEQLNQFIQKAHARVQEHAALPPAPVIEANEPVRTVGATPNVLA